MTVDEPAGFKRGVDLIKEELDTEIMQDPKSDSDEGQTEELVVEIQRWRYPLKQKYLEQERIMLTDEADPESFGEAMKDAQPQVVNCHAG